MARRGRSANRPALAHRGEMDFRTTTWRRLTPRQRHLRSWRMRLRLKDPQAVHDAKLWPRI